VIVELGSDWRQWQAEQWKPVSQSNYSIEVVHRGAGKSVFALMRLLGWALERPGSTSAYIGPLQRQTRAFAWPLAKRLYGQVPGVSFNETEMRVDLPDGARILFLGSENADAIRGATLNGGVVLDEVSDIGPVAWGQVIYPAVNRPGVTPRVIVIGTVKGSTNLLAQLYRKAADTPGWHRAYITVEDSGVYSADEIARLKREMNPDDFNQEMMLDWSAAIRGAYFGQEMSQAEKSGRIGRVPHDPALKVHTSIDLGIRHAFVVWLWQNAGPELRAIGCKAYIGSSIPEIWSDLNTLRYNWGQHYAPHDAKVRELNTGKSRIETAGAIGWKWQEVPEIGLKAGIEATRLMIPRVWFDREACANGIEALRQYAPEWRDESQVYSLQPKESWANDFADAFRMFAVGSQGRKPAHEPLVYRDKVVA
jgi:hypothetical protein